MHHSDVECIDNQKTYVTVVLGEGLAFIQTDNIVHWRVSLTLSIDISIISRKLQTPNSAGLDTFPGCVIDNVATWLS